jgi:4-amino-4-deoxy-L-arabinose transferase-like glycosyltransferase
VREGLTRRLWLAAVIVAFCLPLFAGLGRTDMENDEAIYSYAVDGILATGDWLNPPLSPHQDWTFLEKPPLKFWLVAAPIAAGLLPHDELGMRVWDALFGSLAFLYVFAVGRRLAGPVCGLIAVLVLFVYQPLLFNHGLRNNNMEAPLLLCYCGGVYHYLAWAATEGVRERRRHVAAVFVWFFLGFMTKFVASFFLPIVLAVALAVDPATWTRFRDDFKTWVLGALATLAVASPWFIYQTLKEGRGFWRVLVGEHVVQRFTSSLDTSHLQPWHYYFSTVFDELARSGTWWLTVVGAGVLLVQLVRERRREQVLVAGWFLIPLALMSIGTSKIHHYAYPFLPPLALAAGYAPALLLRVGRSYVEAGMEALQRRVKGTQGGGTLRYVLLAIAVVAVMLSIATFALGQVQWKVGETVLFRNSHVARPLAVALVLALFAGRGAVAARLLWPICLLLAVIPVNAYENVWKRTQLDEHPVRTMGECLSRVQQSERQAGRPGPGVLAIGDHRWFLHSYYYYLRHVGWERIEQVQTRAVDAALVGDGYQRPILIPDVDYRAIRGRYRDVVIPMLPLPTVLLLTPGPYAVCGPRPAPGSTH